MQPKPAPGRIEGCGKWLLEWLETGNPAATIDRLSVSNHVRDLRFIMGVALLLLCLSSIFCLIYAAVTVLSPVGTAPTPSAPLPMPSALLPTPDPLLAHPIVNGIKVLSVFVGVLATLSALFGAIGAWAYKVGSTRLGVVDLFACEISTLCRVALVSDAVGRQMDRIERAEKPIAGCNGEPNPGPPKPGEPSSHGQPSSPSLVQFTSAENYFPVFEGNTRDLQSLEARVVINITSFYTYMKAFRDLMRSAAALKSEAEKAEPHTEIWHNAMRDWHNAMRDVIYMLFLGLEAGRNSIDDLVEFEPELAERTIVVLLSELKAYLFLLQECTEREEMYVRRLHLRWDDYQKLRSDLPWRVEQGLKDAVTNLGEAEASRGPRTEVSLRELELKIWRGADGLLPDLKRLYQKLGAIIPEPERSPI
jgi:hypothetical protein